MELLEKINKLNYKYQFVKNNKYWDYNTFYNLKINGKSFSISENAILFNISNNIANNTNLNNDSLDTKVINDFILPNTNIEQMKNIVKGFFESININISNKIDYLFSKTKFIKYDDNISNDQQRSVTTLDEIKLYYKNDLKTLITLAHEISHGLANLDDNCKLANNKKLPSFAEIESELTEEIFLEYIRNNNLMILDLKSEDFRQFNDIDIDNIKYNKYKNAIYIAYRAIDELKIKEYLKNKNISNIDNKIIKQLSIDMNVDEEEIISKMNMFIDNYYPGDKLVHDYIGKSNYDLKNGNHLSNESRFIYAYCFIEKFNEMNLNYNQKCEFYNNYLTNAKNMSFQDVLKIFNASLTNDNDFSNEFINKFNDLTEVNNIYKNK